MKTRKLLLTSILMITPLMISGCDFGGNPLSKLSNDNFSSVVPDSSDIESSSFIEDTTSSYVSSDIMETPLARMFKDYGDPYNSENGDQYYIFMKIAYRDDMTYQMWFMYNETKEYCYLSSTLTGTYESGTKFDYEGNILFYWGHFKEGLFVGYYHQYNANGNVPYIEVDFTDPYFKNGTIYRPTTISYTMEHNDFTSCDTDDIISMYARIEECADYAVDVFNTYGYDLSLY